MSYSKFKCDCLSVFSLLSQLKVLIALVLLCIWLLQHLQDLVTLTHDHHLRVPAVEASVEDHARNVDSLHFERIESLQVRSLGKLRSLVVLDLDYLVR